MTGESCIQTALSLIKIQRFPLGSEAALQVAIENVFQGARIPIQREVQLSLKDRIDFYLPDAKTGIEVKIKGGKMAIYKQCERYCEHDQISNLILVTNRAMGFPQSINGKPCYVVQLGQSWL